MTLIVDASVAIKWFKREHDSPVAELVPLADTLAAPEMLLAELCNACWKAFRLRLLTAQQMDATPTVIRRYVGMFYSLEPLAPRAVFISRALDHPVYDCFYIALAEREAAPLVTADRRLLAKLASTPWAGTAVDLASFAPPP